MAEAVGGTGMINLLPTQPSWLTDAMVYRDRRGRRPSLISVVRGWLLRALKYDTPVERK
ncbi:MAG TPA: hypothetical protein VEA38_18225 [Terriglobales bacterium]|nr:hypothetical protein [Terriglobales bacterium]